MSIDNEDNGLKNLEAAFNSVHLSMYTDEFAAQLLAFFFLFAYEIGEQAVLNIAFREAIKICSNKFNISGGKIPNANGILLMNKFIKAGKNSHCVWIKNITQRYKLKGFNKIF